MRDLLPVPLALALAIFAAGATNAVPYVDSALGAAKLPLLLYVSFQVRRNTAELKEWRSYMFFSSDDDS